MADLGAYTGYESDPRIKQVIGQLLSGELSPAQRTELTQQRELGQERIAESFAGRGFLGSAEQSTQQRYLSDIAMRSALMAGQQQQQGLQFALPYERFQADQYYRPRELELERFRTEQQYQDPAWYEQVLGLAGQALPYGAQLLAGRGQQ